MSGLIWAGMGKGIADAGATFGNAMMRGIEEERRAAMEAARDERIIKREEEREQRKLDAVEAAAKKDADIYEQAEKSAVKVGEDRRFAKFKRDVGQTEMSDEELRNVFDQQYDQRKVGNFEGAARYTERYSQQKEDVLNEIRKLGGSSGLINQARDVFKATQDAEAKADKLAFDEKRFEAMMPINQQKADAATTRAEAAVTSANRPRATTGSTASGDKPINGVDLERAAKAAEKALALELGVPVKDLQSEVARLKKRGQLSAEAQTRLDSYNAALSRWQNYKSDTKSSSSGDNRTTPSYKVGETRTVQSGPNKGKTAEWDGNGWVLK